MDREYYNSLQEAYHQIQEQGGPNDPRYQQIKNRNKNQPEWAKNAGNAINNFLFPKKTERKPTVQQQQRAKLRNRGTGSTPTATETPTPKVDTAPQSQPAAAAAPRQAATAPRQAAAAPAPKTQPKQSGISGTSASGSPIRTSDVQRRNAAAADRASKVRASGGDPTAGGEFKTKVTDTGSARLNKALSGIGKWNEEELLDYANTLVEQNYCDTVESALIVLQHLSPEALDEALG